MFVNNQTNLISQTFFETNQTATKSAGSATFADYMESLQSSEAKKTVPLTKLLLNLRFLWIRIKAQEK